MDSNLCSEECSPTLMDAISGSGSSALAGAGATSSKHQKTFRGAADEGELEK